MEILLGRCLESLELPNNLDIMFQTEVLVVIDGATDRSKDIALKYQSRFPQVFRVIEKENGNYGSCINRGLKEAKGKYIKILDADDCLDSNCYVNYLEALSGIDVDLVLTSGKFISEDNHILGRWKFDYKSGNKYNIKELKPLWIHYITYKTDILRKMDYKQTEGISYTDEEWCFYPILAVKSFFAQDLSLYHYTVDREGQTMNPKRWIKSMNQEIQVTLGMLHFIEHQSQPENDITRYMWSKINDRLSSFYNRVLIQYGLYNNPELLKLDDVLCYNYKSIYNYLNHIAAPSNRFQFYYILYWRNHRPLNPIFNRIWMFNLWVRMRSAISRMTSLNEKEKVS